MTTSVVLAVVARTTTPERLKSSLRTCFTQQLELHPDFALFDKAQAEHYTSHQFPTAIVILMKTLEFSYDDEGDILYITFQRKRKALYQSLNDNIILRYNPRTLESYSLTLIDLSAMIPQADHAAPVFALDRLADLPPERREQVLGILNTPPVTHWLRVTSAGPAESEVQASLNQPQTILNLLRAA